MTPVIQLKKGQLRIRWPFVKHSTWEKTCADLGKYRQHSKFLEDKVESMVQAHAKEVDELKKTIASRIHFHVGCPDTIRVTNERGVETSMTAAATTHLLNATEDSPGRMTRGGEDVVVRGELMAYAYTAGESELIAFPRYVIKRMADVLAEEVIKKWREIRNDRFKKQTEAR